MIKINKKIIIISIVIGIVLIASGLILNMILNKNGNTSDDLKEPENVVYIPITHYSELGDREIQVSNVLIDDNNKNDIVLIFDLTNNLDVEIENKKLNINYYNGSNITETSEFIIPKLGIYDMITVRIPIVYNYQNITKYEFVYEDFKTEINPIIK